MSHTFIVIGLGCLLIGAASGLTGSFALLKRQSLLGDAVAHCALPGLCLAFLFTGTRSTEALLLGALVTGLLGAACVAALERYTRISADVALALMLSTFFGFGLVLLTWIQKLPLANQSGLESFLFGQAATMLVEDVRLIAVLSIAVVFLFVVMWKEFAAASFDPEFTASLGWNLTLIDLLMVIALVVAVVIGLQTVGVVLVSALIVAPAASARQWTNRLAVMVGLSGLVGMVAGIGGVWLSSLYVGMPTGPMIILVAAGLVVVSLLFGSRRGVVWANVRRRRSRRGVMADQLLLTLYHICSQHDDPYEPRELGLIRATQLGEREYSDLLDVLENRGLVRRIGRYRWSMTATGYADAAAKATQYDAFA